MLQKIRDSKLTLEKEDNVAGFLRGHLNVNHDKKTVELTRPVLIDRIIHAMGVNESTTVKTLAECFYV